MTAPPSIIPGPAGNIKSNIASLDVPLFITDAVVPPNTVPTFIVAALPFNPIDHD